jgi:YVTN family beta-propeller protein
MTPLHRAIARAIWPANPGAEPATQAQPGSAMTCGSARLPGRIARRRTHAAASPSPAIAASCFKVTATIHVAPEPFGVAVNLATNTIYVTNGTVQVIDGHTNKITATVGVGKVPAGVAVDQNIGKIFVASANSDSASVIDEGTNRVTATFGVGREPLVVAANPRTHAVYTANFSSGTVSVITRHCRT